MSERWPKYPTHLYAKKTCVNWSAQVYNLNSRTQYGLREYYLNHNIEIFPTLEKLVWREHIQFTSPYDLEECISKLKLANKKKVSSLKLSTFIDKHTIESRQVRFAIENWYGSVKVWSVGTISQEQGQKTLVSYDIGISQINIIIYAAFPLLAFPLLYRNSYSFIMNLIVISLVLSFFYFMIWLAFSSTKGQLQNAILKLLSE